MNEIKYFIDENFLIELFYEDNILMMGNIIFEK